MRQAERHTKRKHRRKKLPAVFFYSFVFCERRPQLQESTAAMANIFLHNKRRMFTREVQIRTEEMINNY
jgi:hypothetical protein